MTLKGSKMTVLKTLPKLQLQNSFIGSYTDGASKEYCDKVINAFNSFNSFEGQGKGDGDNNLPSSNDPSQLRFRKDDVLYLEDQALPMDGYRIVNPTLMQETKNILSENLQKYIKDYPSLGMQNIELCSIKIQKTEPKGGFHVWHCEHQTGNNHPLRVLAWTIYLNDIPEGEGETEFLEYGIRIPPKKGSVCFFPASFTHTHRGNAVYSCDKYIATGWYVLKQPKNTEIPRGTIGSLMRVPQGTMGA
tara:strand:- start:148 stop:888 length:741 start_codon:yes stop_codon:yes gene_type:complete